MTGIRADVAALLRAGATRATIKRELHVGDTTITRTRRTLRIPLPPGRAKRTRAQLDAVEAQAVALLRDGVTYVQIRARTGLSHNVISRLRKQHKIPVTRRRRAPHPTLDEAYALHTRPTSDGHVLWTKPRSGRGVTFNVAGRKYNARAVAFQRHHGREPQGPVRRTCTHPACIAGAHHTDHLIRTGATR